MPEYVNPVTDEHLVEFDRYMQEGARALNLLDWRIERSSRRSKKNMAEVSIDVDARLATYKVGVSFGSTPVTAQSLRATAFHELGHIFLYEAITNPSEGGEHRCIHVLERLLMEVYDR